MNACDPNGKPPLIPKKTVGKMGLKGVSRLLNVGEPS